MIYIYDSTKIAELEEYFSKNKKIDVTRILSHEFNNLVEIEDICRAYYSVDYLVVDLSALTGIDAYNRNRIFFALKEGLNYPIFVLNRVRYESLQTETPFLFEDEEINFDFAVPEIPEISNEYTRDIDSIEDENKIQDAIRKLVGHDLFKDEFVQRYANFKLLERVGVRKIFSVFLIGESGIGKTEFAKILSESLYPEEELIKINFGNYSTEGVLNSLIGSPLGYVGSDEGGELIKKISSSKSKIILIDEFEKATPAVFNFFYELLEDGRFTDRHGVAHNLTGYTIVFTSNMTSEYYIQYIPAPLRSRFDLLSDFIVPSIEEKQLFIKEQADSLVNKLNSLKKEAYKISDELMIYIMNFSNENNLRHIKRLVQDAIVEDFIKKHRNE
ncbi:AAA family ATPase [Streptococcus halichoeri]|uniref:AAA family ATPase n=1 Tax=Streptococcus halichoeri TaxID=254785 RepID=UPI00135AA5D6|nr:AAA family ATPase [Streptococcus halichoeri]